MTVYQCGFIASDVSSPGCSKDIASAEPVPVTGAELATVYQGGWGFGIASSSAGEVFAWGVNAATLLDKQGSADDGSDPAQLDLVTSGKVIAGAAGFDHAVIVTEEAGAQVFGPATAAAGVRGLHLVSISLPVPIISVAAGEHHTLLLSACGELYGFGSNSEGQLGGAGVDSADAGAAVAIAGPGAGTDSIKAIAAGARHSLAVTDAGRVLAWGWALHGQTGGGLVTARVTEPTVVEALGPIKVASVAAGLHHSVALTEGGDVYCWGGNADGQLGDGSVLSSLEPKLLEAVEEPVRKIAAGARHTLLLTQKGQALAMGYGAFGATGTGSYQNQLVPTPVVLPAGATVRDVAAGWWHSLFVVAQ